MPQQAHLIPQGGLILLPIYFFTLIAVYKYGWQAGLLTAIFFPLTNHLLFGIPPVAVLPAILTKSVLLANAAAIAASHYKRTTIPILTAVILTYQTGTIIEWILTGSLYTALQDFRIGILDILLQLTGGYVCIKHINIPTQKENR